LAWAGDIDGEWGVSLPDSSVYSERTSRNDGRESGARDQGGSRRRDWSASRESYWESRAEPGAEGNHGK